MKTQEKQFLLDVIKSLLFKTRANICIVMYLHKNQESEINENCSVPYENLPPSTIQQNYEGMYNFTSSQWTKTIDNCGIIY